MIKEEVSKNSAELVIGRLQSTYVFRSYERAQQTVFFTVYRLKTLSVPTVGSDKLFVITVSQLKKSLSLNLEI